MKTLLYNINIYGYEFHGSYELEEAEEATETSPAYKAFATVLTACLKGYAKNIYSILDPALIQAIERQLEDEAS